MIPTRATTPNEHFRSRRITPHLALALLLTLGVGFAPAARGADPPEAPPPPTPGLSVGSVDGWTLYDAVLPGPLLGFAVSGDSSGALWALTAPTGSVSGDGEVGTEAATDSALFRLVARGEGRLVRDPRPIPTGSDDLDLADLDGDGAEDILLSTQAAIHAAPAAETSRGFGPPVLQGPGMRLDLRPTPVPLASSGGTGLVLGSVGSLRRWSAESGRLTPVATVELPVDAGWSSRGIALSSPALRASSRPGSTTPLHVAGPRQEPGNRLSMVLIDFAAEEEERRREVWLRLPDELRYLGSSPAWIDGAPVLFVQASESGLFEEIVLLLYPLRGDRSQRGIEPTRRIETVTALWSRLLTQVRDLDGDGKDDLILVQTKGRQGGEVVVDAYAGLGDGRFGARPRRVLLDGPFQGFSYGEDLTGDGLPDLVAADGARMLVFAGVAGADGGPVTQRPEHRLRLPELGDGSRSVSLTVGSSSEVSSDWVSALGTLLVRDLDGDGKAEILAMGDDRGRGRIRVLRLDAP